MSGLTGKRASLLVIPILALAATAARADQATYVVRGLAGAAAWGIGDQPGTEAFVFALTQAAPKKGDSPAPGPRVVFSVTQWSVVNDAVVRRQWFGDAPLQPEWLPIRADLTAGGLDATVTGILEEQGLDSGVVRREVPGRIQVTWEATSGIANAANAFTYQTPPVTAVLQLVGAGRVATAVATITVEAMGPPIKISSLGSLANVSEGLVTLKRP
jgi:hypothetical protein